MRRDIGPGFQPAEYLACSSVARKRQTMVDAVVPGAVGAEEDRCVSLGQPCRDAPTTRGQLGDQAPRPVPHGLAELSRRLGLELMDRMSQALPVLPDREER